MRDDGGTALPLRRLAGCLLLLLGANAGRAMAQPADAPDFAPPAENALPGGEFGQVVRQGKEIFTRTDTVVPQFTGNHLQCSNCHLDAGRKADSAPLWAAYGLYPAYRRKNHHVNTFAERIQECFRYSMDGRMPPAGDPALVALESYAYWLATGAPAGKRLKGQGYPRLERPPQVPDYARGAAVYAARCAACHQADGSGAAAGGARFPALWGAGSFNWGAGMHQVSNAAGFIKVNMPLGQGFSLSDQQAWDVALFVDSHERPQDPRFTGSVADTRRQFHDDPDSMYGQTVDSHVLGAAAPPAGEARLPDPGARKAP